MALKCETLLRNDMRCYNACVFNGRSMKRKQTGSIIIITAVVLVVIIGVITGVLWSKLSQDGQAPPKTNTPASSYDPNQPLTSGNTNEDLTTDVTNVSGGVANDSENLKAAEAALNDEKLPVGE